MFITSVQLPSGSTQQQTLKVVQKVEQYFFTKEKDNVVSVFSTVGSGPGGNGQNVARMFVRLKDWDARDTKTGTSFAIIERATKAFSRIKEARVFASSPPAISGLGSSAGFDMELQDHAGAGHTALMAARDKLLELAGKDPGLTRVRHNGLDDSPQLQVDIDQRKAQALGVSIDDINDTLQTAWGSSYVNDFMDRGRVKKCMCNPPRHTACCRTILTAGMSATMRAAWCRSPPSPPRTGRAVLRVWSAITAIPPLRSSVKPRRASAPVRRWTPWKAGATAARWLWSAVDGHVLSGAALRGAGSRALRAFAAGGLPLSCGAL